MSTNSKVVGKVYETMEYDVFKELLGNRYVAPSRVAKIRLSIEKNGMRMCPVVVNDNMEIIDGQGRFCALKELGLPVKYVIDKWADIDICRALNINQTNWSTKDYIESFANDGLRDYKVLLRFCNDYEKIPLTVKISVCSAKGTVCTRGRSIQEYVTSGNFEFLYPESDRSEEMEYLMRFYEHMKEIRGSSEFYYSAILWSIRNLKIDKERLVDKFGESRDKLYNASDLNTCFRSIENVYNERIKRENKIYFAHEYQVRVTDLTGIDYKKINRHTCRT